MNRSLARPAALFVGISGALAAIAVTRGLFDPDYFWHLATGRLILQTGRIPRADPFSFTWSGEPWVPDQWLAEVLIAGAEATVGISVMLVTFGFLAALGPTLVAAAALRSRARGVDILAATVLVTAAMLPQVTIRPQVVSFALTGLLLALLMRARSETRHRLWVLPPLFLVWANTHGLFVVGVAIEVVYLVATLAGRTALAPHRTLVTVVVGATLLATMITPSGPAGLPYALSFADMADVGAQRIMEWQSPNFHNLQFLPFLILCGWLLLGENRRAPAWITIVGLAGAILGLLAARAVGVGALLMMPLLTMRATEAAAGESQDDRIRGVMELVAASIVAGALIVAALGRGPVTVDSRRVPTAATEVLRAWDPGARVLATYEWGGYLINELHKSGGTVFVDGRMHKYQPQVMADYLAIVEAAPGWERLVDRYAPDAMLLSPSATVAKGLAPAAGWCELFRDDVQVLLVRECGAEAA